MKKDKNKEVKTTYNLIDALIAIMLVILIGLALFSFGALIKDGLEERTLDRCIKAKDAGLVLENCKDFEKIEEEK